MYREIKINKLLSYSNFVSNLIKGIAWFNKNSSEDGWKDLIDIELYVKNYNIHAGHYSYTTRRHYPDILEIYIDNELALSLTMCEVHELIQQP